MNRTTPQHSPVRLAMIGAGTFVHKAHLPSLLDLQGQVDIVAVCSRSRSSAESVVRRLPNEADIYDDLPILLVRPDIDAVDVVVPIHAMPEIVEMALVAGKHVVSEKPVAPTVARGREMLARYAQCRDQVWMVAENWRYEASFLQARAAIQGGEIGRPLFCHWAVYAPIARRGSDYGTDWRRAGRFPGGFLLDGGVHHVAGLRLILGEIASVSTAVAGHREDLPPADTMSSVLAFANGVVGSYSVTYAVGAPWPSELYIAGDEGALRVQAQRLEISRGGETRSITFDPRVSVQRELAAFVETLRSGVAHRNSPEQALQDVAVIEAMLRSAESGQRVSPEVIV